jgi:outer membrane receptor protein involved in Fe transport
MDLNNFPMATQSAYATVNGRVAVVSLNQGWEVAAWGKNLTNFIPYLADGPVGFGERDLVIYGIPRTYGLEVRLSF